MRSHLPRGTKARHPPPAEVSSLHHDHRDCAAPAAARPSRRGLTQLQSVCEREPPPCPQPAVYLVGYPTTAFSWTVPGAGGGDGGLRNAHVAGHGGSGGSCSGRSNAISSSSSSLDFLTFFRGRDLQEIIGYIPFRNRPTRLGGGCFESLQFTGGGGGYSGGSHTP